MATITSRRTHQRTHDDVPDVPANVDRDVYLRSLTERERRRLIRREKAAERKAKKKAEKQLIHERRQAKKAARPMCESCGQRVDKLPCRECERYRKVGRNIIKQRKTLELTTAGVRFQVNQERERTARVMPEVTKFPRGIRWSGNVVPVCPTDDDMVEVLSLVVDCDRIREMDEFDVRYTIADK